jgi:gluconolactonase
MASGTIVVATRTTGSITAVSPTGDLDLADKMPDMYPTNMCLGGPDRRTASITLSDTGRLGMMQWPEPGLPLNFGSY